MTNHTPTPWIAKQSPGTQPRWQVVQESTGAIIAEMIAPLSEQEANAKRIAASANICGDIPTPTIQTYQTVEQTAESVPSFLKAALDLYNFLLTTNIDPNHPRMKAFAVAYRELKGGA